MMAHTLIESHARLALLLLLAACGTGSDAGGATASLGVPHVVRMPIR